MLTKTFYMYIITTLIYESREDSARVHLKKRSKDTQPPQQIRNINKTYPGHIDKNKPQWTMQRKNWKRQGP